jgi:uncharacterized protein YecE (DUF72 family)
MRFFVGTSGYSYPAWKGSFYPQKLSPKKMLSYYAQQFSTVEINGFVRKPPSVSVVESWVDQVAESFRFVVKAPQTITHYKRLKDTEEVTDQLVATLSVLKQRQGPVLFQLPPNFKKDLARLEPFLKFIDHRLATAFEFRHASWFDDEVFDCLRAHSCALCVADMENAAGKHLVSSSRWGYVRLRGENYNDAQLRKWIKRLKAQNWDEAYVFFKHEDGGTGPKLASRFLELAAG